MTTITQLRNIETNATIVLNVEAPKLAQFRDAAVAGFTGGQTSFRNLLNGKTASVKGWVLEVVEEKKVEAEVTSTFNAVAALEAMNVDVIKEAKTETYGTIANKAGRFQLNPLRNGKFSVMFFPKKGVSGIAIALHAGHPSDVKSQYVKFGKMDAEAIMNLQANLTNSPL